TAKRNAIRTLVFFMTKVLSGKIYTQCRSTKASLKIPIFTIISNYFTTGAKRAARRHGEIQRQRHRQKAKKLHD
ncbi:MAG: hypothetical protein VB068_00610, partial [Petrimonas sp.]|nr:hypothetical protein [Petrimonas sp.]